MWLFSAFLKMVRLEFFGISLKNRLFLRKFSIFETGSKSKFYVCKGPHKVNRSEGKHAQTCLINQSLWAYIQYMYKVQFCTRKGGKEGFLFFEVKRDKVALNFSWLLNSVLFYLSISNPHIAGRPTLAVRVTPQRSSSWLALSEACSSWHTNAVIV